MNFFKLKLNLLVLFFLLSALPMSQAVVSVQTPETKHSGITKASMEKHLGRQLTFSEKIAFKILSKKIARAQKKQRKFKANGCAKIALKTGEVLEVDLIQISPTEVKYKRCNKPEDPEFIVAKKDVYSIQGKDGEILYSSRNSEEQIAVEAKEKKEKSSKQYVDNRITHGFAVASLASSILSLLLIALSPFALLLSALAIVLGVIAQRKIERNPKLYKGKHIAGAGIIIGGIICFLYLVTAFLISIFI